jgi:quinoprotein relay system zinc metallohydrolase 2
MFEAVFSLCLAGTDAPCRDVLVPGYEAETLVACTEALTTRPPEITEEIACRPAPDPLPFEEIAPGVFAHLGDIAVPNPDNLGDVSNIGFIVGSASVAVIDTGGSRSVGEGVWRAIRSRTDLPVSHVVLTHMHPDHVLGASVFVDAGADVLGHNGLGRALADRRENYLVSLSNLIGAAGFLGSEIPDVSDPVQQEMTIDLGDRPLSLRPWPMAHTGTDVTVIDASTGTLFAGDLVFQAHTPALDGSLKGWRSVLEDLQAMAIDRVVPGHGGPVLDWPVGAEPLVDYLDVLESETRAAIDAGKRIGEAAETVAVSEAPKWELFDEYNPRNATVAYTELEWE